MDGNRFSMQKLNNSNYNSWRFKMELLLVREELWRYVDPGTKPEKDEQVAWDAGVAKTRATIGLLIDDNQHGLIRASKTAKEAWLALQNHHRKTSLTSKVSLLKRICAMRFSKGDDMAEHLFAFEDLFEQLSNAGQALPENLRVAMILSSLPSLFDTLTTALESRNDADLTMELVKRKLLDEVNKHQEGNQDLVLKVGAGYGREKKKPLVCYQCRTAGHKKQDCPQLKRAAESSSKTRGKPQRKKEESVSFAFGLSVSETSNTVKQWVIDSGATSHTVADRGFFTELHTSDVKSVKLADGKMAPVEGQGCGVLVCCDENGERREVSLGAALYTPSLAMNLVSVPELTKKNAVVIFDARGCRIMRGEATVAVAPLKDGLYQLKQPHEVVMLTESHHNKNCKHVWHRRFGHRDPKAISRLENKNLATGLKVFECGIDEPCECCLEGKSSRTSFPKERRSRTYAPMDLVHTDVCGPVEVTSVSGYRYFMTVIDDFSRYCVLYFLKQKSEVAAKIEEYVALAENQFGRKPKVVRSDRGGEYTPHKLMDFYKREGIQAQLTAGYSPQQNGVAERKNRYLVEMTRCMLFDSKLHHCYWAEALSTAVYLQNILPTRAVKLTPWELWHGIKPDVEHLKVFGCSAWVHVPKEKRKKLAPTAQKMTFVGYSSESKAYRFIDTETRTVTVSRDVRFIEGEPGVPVEAVDQKAKQAVGRKKIAVEAVNQEEIEFDSVLKKSVIGNPDESVSESDDEFEGYSENELLHGIEDSDEIERALVPAENDVAEIPTPGTSADSDSAGAGSEPRRSNRTTKGVPPERIEVTGVTKHSVYEPRSYSEAIQGPEKSAWQSAMEEEISSLNENQTWELVELPPGRKLVGCKWTYKKKEDENGQVVRYKARLVAQGFSQQYGIDFDEVFAPVAKQATLRTLLSIASRKNMVVKHLDIKCAYLYADLEEDIYMRQPPGFQSGDNLVCRLKRSLYGLKQSARMWNKKIDGIIKKMQFQLGEADSCLYVRNEGGKRCFILIYVDDMVVFCNSEEEFASIRTVLKKQFKLSSLGDLRQFLGIHVDKVDGHYTLDQKGYIEKIVGRFGHEDANHSKIPIDPAYLKQKEEKALETNASYRSLVGSLLYVAVNTRPDICVSTSFLCRKVEKPTNRDWTEAKRALRYLKGTKDLRLHLGGGLGNLECFADADWAGYEGDRKSNSGFLIKYGGGLVSWGTRKQTCVSLSSTEAEFVALSVCCQELLWTKKLLRDLGEEEPGCVVVWEDNQSCIKMVESDRIENRSKHIDTKHAFTKDLRQRGVIDLRYLSTDRMEADIMTKPLERIKLERHREAIGVKE